MVSEAEAETAELTGSSGSLPRSAASLLRYCLSCLSGEAKNAQYSGNYFKLLKKNKKIKYIETIRNVVDEFREH